MSDDKPELDPEPWVRLFDHQRFEWVHQPNDVTLYHFDPRPEYSQNREDY